MRATVEMAIPANRDEFEAVDNLRGSKYVYGASVVKRGLIRAHYNSKKLLPATLAAIALGSQKKSVKRLNKAA